MFKEAGRGVQTNQLEYLKFKTETNLKNDSKKKCKREGIKNPVSA
jgi:hypothetical protein